MPSTIASTSLRILMADVRGEQSHGTSRNAVKNWREKCALEAEVRSIKQRGKRVAKDCLEGDSHAEQQHRKYDDEVVA